MKQSSTGIELRGQWFAVERPNGRRSRYLFRSPFMAAEHVMRAAGSDYWPVLARKGVRVVAVWTDEFVT